LKGYNQVVTRQLEVVYEAGALRPLEPLPFAEKQHLVVTVTDELDPKATFGAREREQEWLRVNGPRYAGKWLAIEGDQLVGVGDNARVVLEQARANGIAHPLLVQIPNDPQLPFGGW
jgi:predicted DNA-binding antitoxin AbrB/MazE fold protein